MKLDRRSLLKQLGVGAAAGSLLNSTPAIATTRAEWADVESPRRNGGPIRLDRNENAYGASKKAMAAIQESAGQMTRYADGNVLLNELAAYHSGARPKDQWLKPEQVVLGCGSSDVLRMAASAFLPPTSTLIVPAPTCDVIAGFGKQTGATVSGVPLRKDHAHDLNAMLELANKTGAGGLIYICNPNSPTGTLTTRKELEEFLGRVPVNFYVVIDEAYHHYAGGSGAYVSFVDRPVENERVVVTRTFSTAHGLAGGRLGYAVASESAAGKLRAESLPFAVNRAGLAAASAALSDRQHVESCAKRNFDDRQEFMNQVNARMLRALDSHTNFICLNVMRPADEILEHYQKNNFLIAPLIPSMPTYLRISLGNPQEMAAFWRVWDLLGSHPMSM